MGEKIVVGPINKGFRNDRTAFVIDNDSFPTLINAFQWRGRVKRKRGTSLLNRLTRFFNSTVSSYSSTATINLVGGASNILSGFSLQTNGNIVPGSVTINDVTVPEMYTDLSKDGTLSGNMGGTGTINYATGEITISGGGANAINATFRYFPNIPVLGLREFESESIQFPGTLAFDTTYSYNILTAFPYSIYDVSFYKNLTTGDFAGYTQKTNWTPTSWNGQDYQQFWSVNYQNAFWVTNGINVPFSTNNIGMHFNKITAVAIIDPGPSPPASITITTDTNHSLVVGDFVFINEIVGMTGINFQTGYVTAVPALNQITVTLPNATVGGAWGSRGIVQYLTNRSDPTIDCIRWYDGDPTDGNATTPTLTPGKGWVNFCPPLSQSNFSVSDLPLAQYYLVGARMIINFKDRLLFLGPVVQASSGTPKYLQDTVIYSQNGTPYYTCSYSGTEFAPTNAEGFVPILRPANQTADPKAFWEDQAGFGGFIQAGINQQIISASSNEDALIIGFSNNVQTRFVYTGNDVVPFNFFIINTEYGTSSTFSAINLDKGVITRSSKGFVITSQTGSQRIDLEIPDQVFETNLTDNGPERVCARRDFINEWIYFTYPSNESTCKFPNQTLQYNYRDDSWAIFNESYTTYGSFRRQTGFIWSTVGTVYPTWSSWNDPWNAGTSTLLQPEVIAGNQQGFVLFRDEGTNEGNSLYITNITSTTVTSHNHCLNDGDYIIISGCIGTIASEVNGYIFKVGNVTTNTFSIKPNVTSGTYLGGGVIKRMYKPFIQTKQFPVSWNMSRKTRLGPQQYLFTTTSSGKIQLLIYLSQNGDSAYNTGPIVPSIGSTNNSLIYSTTLYTSPESTNLGLTPANINLQIQTSDQQLQTWHRMNTSLIGDTVQIGFTLSDEQMEELEVGNSFEITGATQAATCVLTCSGEFDAGQLIRITGVEGMTELNDNIYVVLSSTPTEVTINVNSSAFTAYSSGGEATMVAPNQFSEIELHGFILDVSPSQLLV